MTNLTGSTNGPMAAWQQALMHQMEQLGRWIQGRLVVNPRPDDEVVPATRYLDTAYLRAAVARASSMHVAPGDIEDDIDLDLRIAVSRFTRQYASSVSAVALVALAQGVGLDVSAARCQLVVRSNIPFLTILDTEGAEMLRCAERPTAWPIEAREVETLDELRTGVWRSLYAGHLEPVFSRVLEVTNVSRSLVWTNAAEWVGYVSDSADEFLEAEAANPFFEDRQALLSADTLPGVRGPNPLKGLLTYEPFDSPHFPHGVQVRGMCCLTYMLADRLGRLCQNCGFLSLDDRVALIRERHGVPMGTPGGPAEERSIEVGRRKHGLAGSDLDHS